MRRGKQIHTPPSSSSAYPQLIHRFCITLDGLPLWVFAVCEAELLLVGVATYSNYPYGIAWTASACGALFFSLHWCAAC